MKKILTLTAIVLFNCGNSQQLYCDFEGTKMVYFGEYNGVLDSNANNPNIVNTVNLSTKCGRYIRDTAQYDNLKVFPMKNLADVSAYANASGPKITMKVYSTAPAGSLIELQLGARNYIGYPAGVHSQYTATISASKTWQLVSFNYFMSPSGSSVTATQIDKIVILYKPNTHIRDTMYFDDLTGPDMPVGIDEQQLNNTFMFVQNVPNPANEKTEIQFVLGSDEQVFLNVSDLLGHNLYSQNLKLAAGEHAITVNTTDFPEGIYFYTLRAGNDSKSYKMVVAR